MTGTYVRVLKESLCRKKEILNELVSYTSEQKDLVDDQTINWDRFDEIIAEKEKLIQELEKLDDGFDQVFSRVKEELTSEPEKYAEDISFMKKLIGDITSLSATLESQERRNKTNVEKRVMISRKDIRQKKVSSKVASAYYQNAKQLNLVDPQLLDKKN